MSRLSIKEPWWWHTKDGGHRMQDPRVFDIHPQHLSSDERAFVKHLEQHEEDEQAVRPRENDTPGVKALFDLLANQEKIVQTTRELITALRKQAKQNRN